MKIYNQWKFAKDFKGERFWGISLFTVFGSADFMGFVFCGLCFEWAISQRGLKIQDSILKKRGVWIP